MTLATTNKLIGAGIAIPLVAMLCAVSSSNPYLVIGVSLVAVALSTALVIAGTVIGGFKIVRGSEQPRTRDLVFVAVGANLLLFIIATAFVMVGKGA